MHPEYCPELWEFKFLPGLSSYQWGCAGGRVLTIDGNVSPAVQTVRLIETGLNGGKSMAVSDLSQPPELKTLEEWVWDHVNESNIRFDTKTPCQHVEAIFAEAEKLIQSGHVAKGQAKFERVKEILGSLEPARYLSAPRHFPEAVHPEMQARLRWSCFRLCMMKTTIERRGVDYTRDRFYQPQDLLEAQWAYLHAWLALQGQGDVPVCRGYTARVIFRQAELKFILNYCSDEISPLLCKAALYAAPDHCLPPNAQPSKSAAWVHHYVHGDDAGRFGTRTRIPRTMDVGGKYARCRTSGKQSSVA
ncbi:hypothetical protein PV05_03404 [Exophiala xenobiotica]|uniref:Uncharacterized protein n=1 Tax=Exophiala xenobiotica TaxID=348802 RepID=A0A0D2C283_9EURO|nr:uncharacterized protein PV05_03404 [Exophiala xenobiotica]KIW58911.1 hypothetical protein PV05_03404 [Exophiala xenobiotica]